MHPKWHSSRAAWRLLAVLLVVTCVAASCGDDGGTASSETTDDPSGEDPGEPRSGGGAELLVWTDAANLDPVKMPGTASGPQAYALYGALVTFDSTANEIVPILAESLEHNDDYTVWTLTLREGLVFSDGTALDAEAVKFHWERTKDPASTSPNAGFASAIASMTVTDELTLELDLAAPNAHFDRSLSRFVGMNSIPSPTAVRDGVDLTSDAVGAGPFLLDEWTRGASMKLSRNPQWYDSPRPYLDTLELRVVPGEQQRVDTFVTGGADGFITQSPRSITEALDGRGGSYAAVPLASGQAISFNTAAPPFDDARVRRAFVLGVDRDALAQSSWGPEAEGAHNIAPEGSPWHVEEGDLPAYDPDEAQRLFSEVAAEIGAPVEIELGSFQVDLNVATAKFIQTALNQFDDVNVEVDIADAPTAVGRVVQGDYQAHTWGFWYLDPEPGLYIVLRSGLPSNYARYENPVVDAALDEAHTTSDFDDRLAAYREAFGHVTDDLPIMPFYHPEMTVVYSDDLAGVQQFEDGIVRYDLLWRTD